MSTITICPPAASHHSTFQDFQFDPSLCGRARHPVHAELGAEGEITSSRISFEDYSRCHLAKERGFGYNRRLPTPEWAVNDSLIQKVLVAYFEKRARIKNPNTKLRAKTRLELAHAKILQQDKPAIIETLKRMCDEYTTAVDPDRKRILESEIKVLDTQLRLVDRGPAILAAVVTIYYRQHRDAVAVASDLGIAPNHVRQLLFRLHAVARDLFGEPEPTQEIVPEARRIPVAQVKLTPARAEYVPPKYEPVPGMFRPHPEIAPRPCRTAPANRILESRSCSVCGKEFTTNRPWQMTCSEECRAEHARRRALQYTREREGIVLLPKPCEICGEMFTPKQTRVTVCYKRECINRKIYLKKRERAAVLLRGNQQGLVNTHAVAVGV